MEPSAVLSPNLAKETNLFFNTAASTKKILLMKISHILNGIMNHPLINQLYSIFAQSIAKYIINSAKETTKFARGNINQLENLEGIPVL